MAFRPGGVTALAVIFIIIGVLGFIGAIDIEAMNQSLITSNSMYALAQILLNPKAMPLAIISYLSSTSSASMSSSFGYSYIVTIGVLIAMVLHIVAAISLLKMKNWGRILALIVGFLDIIGGVILLIGIVGIIPLILGIITVCYLFTDVKFMFE